MRFFFYGTLLDPDVRGELLGPSWSSDPGRRAVLVGYARRLARHGNYPVIVPRSAQRVEGVVFDGLSLADAARVAHFEGKDYRPETLRVTICDCGSVESVLVFMPLNRGDATGQPWSHQIWGLQGKRVLLRRIRTWVRDHNVGELSSQDISWRTRRTLLRAARGRGSEDKC